MVLLITGHNVQIVLICNNNVLLCNIEMKNAIYMLYKLDAATSSGILKAKQKLGRTFNSDKLGGIAFTKNSKLTMCSA